MAHESFEDNETAKIMNQFFVNIKVDREERPDLDFIFQSSFQLFNQVGGGWPLTMFLDENGVPFMGGTYFPKINQNGLPSFKEVLQKVHDAYKEQKTNIYSKNFHLNCYLVRYLVWELHNSTRNTRPIFILIGQTFTF